MDRSSLGRYVAIDDDKETLEHYGVLGMKWGHRKDGKPRGYQYGKKGSKKQTRSEKKAASTKAKQLKENEVLRKNALESHDPEVVAKGMHLLSDEELGMKIKRLTEEHRIDNIRYENKQRELSIAQQSKKPKGLAAKYGDAVVNQIVNEAAANTVGAGKALVGVGASYAQAVSKNPTALDALDAQQFMRDYRRQIDYQQMSNKERSKMAAERFKAGNY